MVLESMTPLAVMQRLFSPQFPQNILEKAQAFVNDVTGGDMMDDDQEESSDDELDPSVVCRPVDQAWVDSLKRLTEMTAHPWGFLAPVLPGVERMELPRGCGDGPSQDGYLGRSNMDTITGMTDTLAVFSCVRFNTKA